VSPPLFRLTGVSFAYDSGPAVLRDFSFTLHAGERTALLGPNGAGKTTLLHVMVGLLRPQAGSIEAFGEPRRKEKDFHAVRARAGLLFQDSDDQLFCPTVLEDVAFGPLNLGLSPAQAQATARETLAMLELGDLAPRVTYKLSGGQKRMVALAAVLAMRPEVLLLDEPTNALDAATRERLIAVLSRLPQAMVLASHDGDFIDRLATHRTMLT
jgi:cobalt/nickel transport system ATP-binding protein